MKLNQFIKDNYLTFTVIPPVLAGVWQILVLANIGAPYIRFFSSTQLLADSVAFLFLVFWLAFFYFFIWLSIFEKTSEKETINYTLKENILNAVRMIAVAALLMFYIVLPMYELNQGSTFVSYTLIVFAFLFLIIGSRQYFSYEGNKIYRSIVNLIFFGLCIFTLINFNSIFNDFTNLENINNVCKSDNCKVRYFNDRYIFIEYTQKSNVTIKVLPFEELFNFSDNT